ncbi:MAG: class I SAM-dependent methyltransferase [Gemmataceae bacterium]|nr:class I SAM-dependent methyltransferase [Gemmataceae bacterium]
MPAPWYQTLFSGLFLDSMRAMYGEAQTRSEAEFLRRALSPRPAARILDVPCGGGRLSHVLAAQGFDVVGVDLCADLVAEAQAKGSGAAFHRRDMRDLPWSGEFDHAYCMGNSFAYLGREGDLAFLRAVADALKPGGTFLLETHLAAECVMSQALTRRWYPMGDLVFLHDPKYDAAASRIVSDYAILKDGRMEKAQAVYQVYFAREVAAMAEQAGLRVKATWGNHAGDPIALGSPGLWIVAEKG